MSQETWLVIDPRLKITIRHPTAVYDPEPDPEEPPPAPPAPPSPEPVP